MTRADTSSDGSARRLRSRVSYLSGADVVSAGVVGAMMGGLICTSAVLKGNVLGQVLKHQAQTLRDKALVPHNPAPA